MHKPFLVRILSVSLLLLAGSEAFAGLKLRPGFYFANVVEGGEPVAFVEFEITENGNKLKFDDFMLIWDATSQSYVAMDGFTLH